MASFDRDEECGDVVDGPSQLLTESENTDCPLDIVVELMVSVYNYCVLCVHVYKIIHHYQFLFLTG